MGQPGYLFVRAPVLGLYFFVCVILVPFISDSPARAKDITKRIRNQLLHAPKARPWMPPSLLGSVY